MSIGLSWLLSRLSGRKADGVFTYGYHRFSLLGALINGVVLIAGSLWILSEAVPRLADPTMPHAVGMFWLAILGVVVNGYAAYKLSHGKTLNERVLNWHLLEDVLGWVAVLIVAIVLLFVDWPIIDPLLSIAFTLFILINVVRNIVTTVSLLMQATPDKALHDQVVSEMLSMEPVSGVHHLHLWSLDGEHHVLTAHLELSRSVDAREYLELKTEVEKRLSEHDFVHTTIEFEFPEELCRDGLA